MNVAHTLTPREELLFLEFRQAVGVKANSYKADTFGLKGWLEATQFTCLQPAELSSKTPE